MRSRIRKFIAVGLISTALDLGLFVLLADRGLVRADLIALACAAAFSYLANRFVTFRNQRNARWVAQPVLFLSTAVLAGAIDLAVVVGLDAAGASAVAAKVVAIMLAAGVRWLAYRWILFRRVRRELADRVARGPAPGEVRFSVILPAYNESGRIGDSVEQVIDVVGSKVGSDDLQVVVVDDGSSDDTVAEAEAAGAVVVRQPRNRGKGAAVRAGVLAASGQTIAFTDADLAYPPELLLDMLTEVEDGWDVVVGSRRHDETTTLVQARRVRELGGRIINLFTHMVLLGRFRDTQCGIKAFRADVGKSIFSRTYIDGFGFDVEVFVIAEQDQFSLSEVPVSVRNRAGSSVRLVGDTAALVRDLIRVRHLAGAGAYRNTPTTPQVVAASNNGRAPQGIDGPNPQGPS